MSHHGQHHSDKGAAYVGLVVSVIFILATIVGVSRMTSASFAGHAKPGAAAPAGGH